MSPFCNYNNKVDGVQRPRKLIKRSLTVKCVSFFFPFFLFESGTSNNSNPEICRQMYE